MIPRKRLDIGVADLLYGMLACLKPGNTAPLIRQLEGRWDRRANLACLSVRSGFDALLATLNLPRGSAVLMSAVNIADMARIVEAHGLTPVPVDIDMAALAVTRDGLQRAHAGVPGAPGARACLIAHLYGSRMPMQEIAAFCSEHEMVLIEDCAQAYTGDEWRGTPEADVTLFSFGPVKPATALGGALLGFRDAALCERVRAHMQAWPVQGRWAYFLRLSKYLALAPFASQRAYGVLVWLCRLIGSSHEAVVSGAVRGFAGAGFLARIRRRPSLPLLSLMARRLARGLTAATALRIAHGERLRGLLGENLREDQAVARRVGADAGSRGHWLFPLTHDAPQALIAHLAAQGFDATSHASSIGVIAAPDGAPPAVDAAGVFERLLYVPAHEGMSEADVGRMAAAIRQFRSGLKSDVRPSTA